MYNKIVHVKMPKKIISKQQIIKAAQDLVSNNLNPTLLSIRKKLNYCGSDSTIHKYLSQWKTECFKSMLQEDCKEDIFHWSQTRAIGIYLPAAKSRLDIHSGAISRNLYHLFTRRNLSCR